MTTRGWPWTPSDISFLFELGRAKFSSIRTWQAKIRMTTREGPGPPHGNILYPNLAGPIVVPRRARLLTGRNSHNRFNCGFRPVWTRALRVLFLARGIPHSRNLSDAI